MNKKFSVTFVLEIDEDNNILSSLDEAHVDDVFDWIEDNYSQYFYPSTTSKSSGEYYYRRYNNNAYLVEWQNTLWYKIEGSGWIKSSSVTDWCEYIE